MQILDWLFPPRCALCDEVIAKSYCCETCYEKLQLVVQPYCYCCGKPLHSEVQEYCVDCQKNPKTFTANRALFFYDEKVRASISRFKFHNRRDYARFYAEEGVKRYGDWILKYHPDAIVPVPIHKQKKRERGYNQAALFGKELAERLDIPFWEHALVRNMYTLPQKQLNNVERVKNLEKAFLIGENNVKLKRLLVVDDIYTTGSTLEACSRILSKGGAAQINSLTIAIGEGF